MIVIILMLSFILSFLITIYGTPITKKVAHRYKILDYPDGRLKKQKEPVPYMGGVIVYFAFIAPVALLVPFNKELLGILFAGSILLIVGLFDDLQALTPQIKFWFQVIATFVLIKSGIFINLLFIPYWLNAVLSFLWILSIINAINIIDIMDGLASSIALIASIIIFILSLFNNNFLITILSLSLAGSLFAFLKFNWAPATIYLGDAGSMLVGMILGSLTIMLDYTTYNDSGFILAIGILAIPIFDITYVIILRIFKGISPFLGSPDHFALRLKKKKSLSTPKTVLYIIFIQLFIAIIVLISFFQNSIFTIITAVCLALFFGIIGLWLADVKMD